MDFNTFHVKPNINLKRSWSKSLKGYKLQSSALFEGLEEVEGSGEPNDLDELKKAWDGADEPTDNGRLENSITS